MGYRRVASIWRLARLTEAATPSRATDPTARAEVDRLPDFSASISSS
jgi:hypothetical protein